MAWNPSPQVAAARNFGKKFGAQQVIIWYVLPDGRYGYASYGQTRRLCDEARMTAQKLFPDVGQAFSDAADPDAPLLAGGKP